MKYLSIIALALIFSTGCASKWLPDTEAPLNPPVAYQQQFIADAIDNAIGTMNFSRLAGKLAEIEVLGVYADGDIADYIRAKIQLELAKAGALSETQWSENTPDYKINVMIRVGGVNDLVKTALFYEWRQKEFTYDIKVAVFSMNGGDYFIQSGKGTTRATIARRFNMIFFPIPLPSEYSTIKGVTTLSQYRDTYNAAKQVRQDPGLMRDRSQLLDTLGP